MLDTADRTPVPESEPQAFQRQLEWVAVQRQLKAIGIFVRLKLRDGRSSHLKHVLPTLEQTIRLTARHAELEALSRSLERLLPDAERRLVELSSP